MIVKYAMVAINKKYDEDDLPIVRRVLIRYSDKKIVEMPDSDYSQAVYQNAVFVDKDPYFEKEGASTVYNFHDEGYELLACNNINKDIARNFINLTRPYHYNLYKNEVMDQDARPIEFSALSDMEAKKIFHARKEKRE